MLWRALKDVTNGFYIDVGAAWPEQHSVTKAFYDRGWSGVNLEPNPELWRQLATARPRDINLELALSDQRGVLEFHIIEGTGLSSLDRDVVALHEANGYRAERSHVKVSTLADVWGEHVGARQVHFLKVDVEGIERKVLLGNDWTQYRPWLVLVEATIPSTQLENHEVWESVLIDADYRFAYSDGLNRFYVAAEQSERLKAFSYPPNSFDGFVLADQAAAESKALAAREIAEAAEAHAQLAEAHAQRVENSCPASRTSCPPSQDSCPTGRGAYPGSRSRYARARSSPPRNRSARSRCENARTAGRDARAKGEDSTCQNESDHFLARHQADPCSRQSIVAARREACGSMDASTTPSTTHVLSLPARHSI